MMTDAEIMKGLACCGKPNSCVDCKFGKLKGEDCIMVLANNAIELINRQKSEIAEYQKHIDQDIIYTKAIKAEAIKAFADRLRFEIVEKPSEFTAEKATVDFLNGLAHRQHETLDIIDNLVKEMTGEKT